MKKQILVDVKGRNLGEFARYLMVYFPFDEDMCTYRDAWIGEQDENKYPLVSKGMWSGVIDLQSHKLLNWKEEYGKLFLQAKVRDEGTYFLFDEDKKVICKLAGYVPNGLIPDADGCGDYIRLRINSDGTIENWPDYPDYTDFIEESEAVEKIDMAIKERPILDGRVEFTYSQLMSKLLRLPKYLQLEIGQTLVANASEVSEDPGKTIKI